MDTEQSTGQRGPENTSRRDPLIHFAGGYDGPAAFGRYIAEQESAGQAQLVHSDRLPTDCRTPDDELRALGFVLGEPDPNDPMFRPATLPEGWRREGSDHAMWSYLRDPNGKKRAAIFCKAAFYDRSAHWSLLSVGSYVFDLLHEPGARPEVDGWATPEAIREGVEKLKAGNAETRELYSRPDVVERSPERAAERRAEVDAEDARLDEIAAQASAVVG